MKRKQRTQPSHPKHEHPLPIAKKSTFGLVNAHERYNLIHGSDGPESAEKEIKMFFSLEEILDYELSDADWLRVKGGGPKK